MKTSDQTIAVVGASARAAAFSLLRAGYRVVTADLFADADLARECPATRIEDYPNGFERWLSETDCDGWLYTGALENHSKLVDRLAKIRPLIGHSGETLRRVRDPLELQRVLQENGFAFPVTHASSNFSPADGLWLAKSYEGSCGSGVGLAGGQYLQRRVEGISLSVIFADEELLGVTRQLVGEAWAGAGEFQYSGSIGPQHLAPEKWRHLQDLGKHLRATFALTNLYGVDLIDDGETLWVLEINPRYTASVEIVERACGISVFGSRAGKFDVNADKEEGGVPAPAVYFGKAVLFAKGPLTISDQMSGQFLQQADKLPWPQLGDIPNPGTELDTGQPVMTIFVAGETPESVYSRLKERVAVLESQLYEGEL